MGEKQAELFFDWLMERMKREPNLRKPLEDMRFLEIGKLKNDIVVKLVDWYS